MEMEMEFIMCVVAWLHFELGFVFNTRMEEPNVLLTY